MVNSIPFRIYHTSTDWYNPMWSNIVRSLSRSTDTSAWLIRWHTAYCNSVLYMDVNVYVYSMVDWFIRFWGLSQNDYHSVCTSKYHYYCRFDCFALEYYTKTYSTGRCAVLHSSMMQYKYYWCVLKVIFSLFYSS